MDKYINETSELIEYIRKSPTGFHSVKNIVEMLNANGGERVYENQKWELKKGQIYYVTRNDSSLIAFRIPDISPRNFQIVASHSDSPAFKIKEKCGMVKAGHYTELNAEKYGGALLSPWFDRPLSIAGRVVIDDGDGISTKLIDFDRDMCMIPSLAIHLNREANDGGKIDVQKTMMPIWGDETQNESFMEQVAELAGTVPDKILGTDLFLYNRVAASVWGAGNEYFSSARIDDLMCAYAAAKAFINGSNPDSICVYALFDNEEVGSGSRQGADSDFLQSTMERIGEVLGLCREEYLTILSGSFMVSADNGHAVHPNFQEKSDPTNQPFLNGGVVIKYNAAQKYTTDGVSAAVFKKLCDKAEVPYQTYVNHSNVAGGSTLGNIAATHVSVRSVDIGAAQLSMHSPYETAGVKDTYYLRNAMEMFYNNFIEIIADKVKI